MRSKSVIESLRQTATGIAILKDWLGDGANPVALEAAEQRAGVCTTGNNGEPCPLNVEPKWWERSKLGIAEIIRNHLEVKNEMNLRVSSEELLHMCRACGCALPLKVHVPIEHIKDHIKPEMMERLVPYCWIRKELE